MHDLKENQAVPVSTGIPSVVVGLGIAGVILIFIVAGIVLANAGYGHVWPADQAVDIKI